MTGPDEILIEVSERVMWITLNKPERHNALSSQMFAGLITALQEGDARSDVGCVVLRGAGPSFSSGFDFGEERGLTEDEGKDLLAVHKSICEKALDMQGRPLMQRLAQEAAAMGHKTAAVREFFKAGPAGGGFKAGLAAAEGPPRADPASHDT
jgi:enoyl-CoA hydratase/carnithine racemase